MTSRLKYIFSSAIFLMPSIASAEMTTFKVGFEGSSHVKNVDYDIKHKSLLIQKELSSDKTGLLRPSLELSVNQISIEGKRAYNYGIGLSSKIPIKNIDYPIFALIKTKIHYLDDFDFDVVNYGGPLQFSYNLGFEYETKGNVDYQLTFHHMSNWDRYDVNPNYESITFGALIDF